MQKRSEANKQMKILFRTRLKRTFLIVLCLFFAYSAIYAADVSNKRMLNKPEEDRYALHVNMEKNDMLRVDVAGEKHYYDVKNVKAFADRVSSKTEAIIVRIKDGCNYYIRSFKEKVKS